MQVYNAVGTSSYKCKCSTGNKSWLAHYVNLAIHALPAKCIAKYCRNSVQVGAHVKEVGGDGRILWIVPFCQYHNKRPSTTNITLKPNNDIVRAAVSFCK